MKKIVFTLLLFMTLTLNAQDYTVKFLGIPIDGTKSEMISKLEDKGFTMVEGTDHMMKGEFNGEIVHVSVVSYHNKVYRIVVQYPIVYEYLYDETDIKIRFNRLVEQFSNNNKYWYDSNINQYLDEDFYISYEMIVNHKQIEADFIQKTNLEEVIHDNNAVWVLIRKLDNEDKFWIAIMYDNLKNEPKGDDL